MEQKSKIKPPCLQINDEYETPTYAFEMLKSFEPFLENKIVWDPFVSETKEAASRILSCFPKIKKIIHSKEFDLLQDRNPEFDIIITNPPFSCKKLVWEKLLTLNKPFCLLVPLETLSRKYITKEIEKINKDLLIIFPQQRVNFIPLEKIKKKQSNSPFHSVWICFHLANPISEPFQEIKFMFLSQDSNSLQENKKRKHGLLSK
jgi:hypothetical protein